MPLHLLLGAAGSGKTRACLDEMRTGLAEPGAPLILLVPEQASHQTERLALDALGPSRRYHVLSFRRLAWRVFQEAGGAARPPITELGRKLVLRAILGRRKPDLEYFGALIDRPGVLDHLSRALRECRAYEVGAADLAEASRAWTGPRAVVAGKLRDLALIMADLEGHLAGRYTDPDQALSRLAERLGRASLAKGSRVWVDGFAGFTPQEYRVLGALLGCAADVTVTLCLDGRGTYEAAGGLFEPTLDTRERLLLLAGRAGHPAGERALASGRVPPRFARAPGIAHLERSFFAPAPDALDARAGDVTLLRAPEPRVESAMIAREILRLCRDERLRMREIAVIVRDPDTYHPLLAASFAEHFIPCFIDTRRGIAHHSLVELLRSAVEAVAESWSYDTLFRFLKTDLVGGVSREQVDRLENLALEHGLRGHARWTGEMWPGPGWMRELRDRATGSLARFHATCSGGRLAVREWCEALYALLGAMAVPATLDRWARGAQERGDLEMASEHLQVHDAVLDLLDQLASALGEETMNPREFLPVLEAGLSGLQLGMVPPGLDQVVVGSVERTRHPDLRVVFVAGANEGSFPRAAEEDAVFDDVEREALARRGVQLGPTSQDRLLSEPYLLYTALTRASDRLYICHSRADGAGRAAVPSLLWSRTRARLPGCRLLEPGAGGLDEVGTVSQLAERVASRLAGGHALPESWRQLHEWLEADPERAKAARGALAAAGWRGGAADLEPGLRDELLPPDLVVSPSRLEDMAACPFKHYARHALRLAPRPQFRVERVDVGRFLHAALDRFVRELSSDSSDLGGLDADDVRSRMARAAAAALAGLGDPAFHASGQARHLTLKLMRALERAGGAMADHARRGRFRPVATELSFGAGGPLPGIELCASRGRRLEVRGRIDRVDGAASGDGVYVLVVDYKTAGKDLAVDDISHGLALQLALYLVVATRQGRGLAGLQPAGPAEIRPGGMLYVPVVPAWTHLAGPPDPDAIQAQARKNYRARGLLSLEAAAEGLFGTERGWSPSVPLRLAADGTPVASQSRVADEAGLAGLLDQALAVARDLGESILDGRIEVAPYRLKDGTPCGSCDFRPVCRFDPALGDAYRVLDRPGREPVPEAVAP